MADSKISALPAAAALGGTEELPVVQGGVTTKTTPAAIETYLLDGVADGQVMANKSGAITGDSGFTFDSVNNTVNLGGGTVTASDPILDLAQTWNNAAVEFTAVNVNVTNTASAAGSLLQDWQVGGVSKAKIDKSGKIYSASPNASFYSVPNEQQIRLSTAIDGDGAYIGYFSGAMWLALGSSSFPGMLRLGATATLVNDSTSHVLAQRNGTNAQTFRVYDTYTDASNYGRLALNTNLTGDWVQVAAETAGTGGDNYGIALTPSGTGAISAQVPDSTAAGGNARGANAVDWQTSRTTAAQAATGAQSVVAGGGLNTVSGSYAAVGGGFNNVASANYSSLAGGQVNLASGANSSVGGGFGNTASGSHSWVPGGRYGITRGLYGAGAYASGIRVTDGDAQVIMQPVRQTTSATSIAYLTTDAAAVSATNCMVLPVNSGCMFTATVTAVHAAGAAVGGWRIEGAARRGASGDATVVGVATVAFGPDAALGAPTVTVVANAGGAGAGGIVIAVTPANATTAYWVGKLELVQAA